MSSLKSKFFLFSNLIVLITALFVTLISVYMYHKNEMNNLEKFKSHMEKVVLLNIKNQVSFIEKTLDDYLNGLTIINDHLEAISKNLYKDNKLQKLIVIDKKGKILFDPSNPKIKEKYFYDYFNNSIIKEKLKKFISNYYKGAEISFVTKNYFIYLKSLKNFPYLLAIVKHNDTSLYISKLMTQRKAIYRKTLYLTILFVIVFIIIIGIILNYFSRPYFELLENSLKTFEEFSKGNLKNIEPYLKIFDKFKEVEIQKAKNGFLKMKEGIGNILYTMKSMTGDINKASTEIKENLNDIVERLTESNRMMSEQLKNTENLSASIIEIEKAVSEIKEYANANKEIANENYEKALTGYNSMKNLTNWLNEISKFSQKIDDIINIINDIAKKTKLLSLNASIEASRAGEYGKGFSIVAEEIRKLADSSSSSTEEIFNHLENINQKISEGIKISEEIFKSLNEIKETAEKNKEDSERIAVAIEQQYSSLKIISENIIKYNEIAENDRKNFEAIISSLEQLEATAQKFSSMADELNNLMKIFKI